MAWISSTTMRVTRSRAQARDSLRFVVTYSSSLTLRFSKVGSSFSQADSRFVELSSRIMSAG